MSSETLFEDSVKHVLGLAKGALAQESVAVSIGGSTVMKPSEFVVRELVQSATFSDRSTSSMGMMRDEQMIGVPSGKQGLPPVITSGRSTLLQSILVMSPRFGACG